MTARGGRRPRADRRASAGAGFARLALATVLAVPHGAAAQDRVSARLAGLNPNLAGLLPDPWTDPWTSPVRWPRAGGGAARFLRGVGDAPDRWEAAWAWSGRGRHGGAVRVEVAAADTGASRVGGTLGFGAAVGPALLLGARVDAAGAKGEPGSWSVAAAAGFETRGEAGGLEVWGEAQRPPEKARGPGPGVAVEAILTGPDPDAAAERLEPVLRLRGGRHGDAEDTFGLAARGPVTWYEATVALRRRWGTAGALAVGVRRGEWRARSACEAADTACIAVVDPAAGTHTVTALDIALELRFIRGLALRGGTSLRLSAPAGGYETAWPAPLDAIGALRPGSARGAFFGLGWHLGSRVRLDAYGYPGPLDPDGADRRVGRYGVQLSVGR